MKPLIAQNGLEYHVNLYFPLLLSNNQYEKFQVYFGNLVSFTKRINDEGILIQFNLNINEEIGTFGRFKDVPGQTEINTFMPIILSSSTYLNSDIIFLSNLVNNYLVKEKFHNRKVPVDIIMLEKKIVKSIEKPEIIICNLVLSDNKNKK